MYRIRRPAAGLHVGSSFLNMLPDKGSFQALLSRTPTSSTPREHFFGFTPKVYFQHDLVSANPFLLKYFRVATNREIMRIYVGNLAEQTTREDLRQAFSAFGPVARVGIAADKQTGKPRGFGLVEMDQAQGEQAIAGLNGTELGDKVIRVNKAKFRHEQS